MRKIKAMEERESIKGKGRKGREGRQSREERERKPHPPGIAGGVLEARPELPWGRGGEDWRLLILFPTTRCLQDALFLHI